MLTLDDFTMKTIDSTERGPGNDRGPALTSPVVSELRTAVHGAIGS
jgi:hypothetical protein